MKKLFLVFCFFILPSQISAQWTIQSSGVTSHLNCIRAVDQNIAWAAGDSGAVIRTTDGGVNWVYAGGGSIGNNIIWNIDAVDSNISFVTITASDTTYLYRTTNGGTDWKSVFSQSSGFLNDIHMIDHLNGIAYGDPVGGKWTIIKTTDGGTSWNRIPTEPIPNGTEIGIYYNSLSVIDSSYIWFLGSQRIYRSSDAGETWSSTATNDYYGSLWFINSSIGMSISNTNAGLSTDSGITWNDIPNLGSGSYYSIAGSGTRDFWTASDGYVQHSTDFGSNWSSELIFFGQIFAIDFVTIENNAIGYVCGSNGIIARYEGEVTSINPSEQNPLSKFSLEQNYPNPFNPSTKINWQSPVSGWQTLKAYDVLGNEVATLVNEYKPAGTYEIEFNPESSIKHPASGVYFYRLQTGDFVETKKMIYLK